MKNEDCAYFYEEVCCNPDCDELADFVDPEFCKNRCRHYQAPDRKESEGQQQE